MANGLAKIVRSENEGGYPPIGLPGDTYLIDLSVIKIRPRLGRALEHELYPTKQQLALRLLAQFKAQHLDVRVHCITADALYGTAPFVDGASGPFWRGASPLAGAQQSEHPRASALAAHRRLFCHPSRDAAAV